MELPRGMKDLEEEELSKIEYVREKFIETSKIFGFKFMDPSPIELLSVLEAKSGPTIRDEIYYFKDKGDREVALRFDFTVGLTRYAVSQKSMKLPAKISSFGGVWRYDEPQKGRYRFFNQWNIEVYGKLNLESETEVIDFTSRLFENLGLKNITIEINNRNLVESYINKVFESKDPQIVSDILRAVDKIQKKSKTEILNEFEEKGYSREKLEKIFLFSEIKGSPKEIEKTFDVSGLESWTELKQLMVSLANREVNNTRINFGIVRGLDYYSGTVFEVFDTTSDLGALAGGGRYDSLTKVMGREDIGATGVAGGVERIVLRMVEQGIIKRETIERIAVVFANDEMQKPAMSLASKLRKKGIPTDIDLSGRSLRKQMESASSSRFAIIIAPKEFSSNLVVIRNMVSGNEKEIPIESLVSNPKSILNL